MIISHRKSFEIRLLGRPSAVTPLHSTGFPSRGFGLLALLALSPDRSLSRAAAADRLWQNASSSANLANMRQLLRRMQAAMPELATFFGNDARTVWLTGGEARIDVCHFKEIAAPKDQADFEELIALYRGDLLDPLDLSGSPLEEAIQQMRGQLRERFLGLVQDGLLAITRYGIADLDLIRAIEQHVLTLQPEDEATHRALIRAYGAIGKTEDARRVFDALSRQLKSDGVRGPERITRTEVVRAEAKFVEPEMPGFGRVGPAEQPRLVLLAPSWVVASDPSENLLRAFVEDLANELGRQESFVTLAAHSSFQASHDGGLIRDNSELRADFSVSCTILPGDDELGELSARMADLRSGGIVWADRFALGNGLLFASGRRIIARVAAAISAAIHEAVLARTLADRSEAVDHGAYVRCLLGRHELKSADLRGVRRARRHYLEAIRAQDGFSEAYAGLASALYIEWTLLGAEEPSLLANARELADTAIRLRPHGHAGYWRKAMVALYQHDFDTCDACFERALELHPNAADMLLDHSDALGFVGDPNHALGVFERAIDLNPTPPDYYWWIGAGIAFSRQDYLGAIEYCARLANEEAVLRLLASSHGQLGNLTEAREYGRRLRETYPGQTAESMVSHQPHRSRRDLQPFVDGLRIAGID